MTPTNEELLRLARKAFLGDNWDALPLSDSGKVVRLAGAVATRLKTIYLAPGSERVIAEQRSALHAALLVLAGELDIGALTRLRAHPSFTNVLTSVEHAAKFYPGVNDQAADAYELLLKLLRGES